MLSATTIGAFLLLAAAHDARGEYMGGVWPPGVAPPGGLQASVRVPPGSWITFDREGTVGMTFDERTGFLRFGVKGKRPALSLQMETGEMKR